jgi:hypothetical protein
MARTRLVASNTVVKLGTKSIGSGEGAAAGQTLVYDGTQYSVGYPATLAGAAVNITNPQVGQILVYNGTTWSNQALSTLTLTRVVSASNPPTAVQSGDSVTVTGTGFVNGATVYVGSLPLSSITVVNSTTITGTLPNLGPNTYHVMLRNNDGEARILTNYLTYGPQTRTYITEATATDANFKNTTLLLKTAVSTIFNTVLTDSSNNNFGVTRGGNLPVSTAGPVGPFGTSGYTSMYATTSNYLYLDTTAADVAVTNMTELTFEVWVYNIDQNWTWLNRDPLVIGQFRWGISHGPGGMSWFMGYHGQSSAICSTGSAIPVNTWTHVAICRDLSNVINMYYNGVAQSVSNGFYGGYVGNPLNTPAFALTMFSGTNAYFSNARITKKAVYTGNFTPPTGPLGLTQSGGGNIAAITAGQVTLLWCQDYYFKDNSTNSLRIFTSGAPTISGTVYPPALGSPGTSVTVYSALFNGTSQFITVADAAALRPGSGPWTIEFWFYPTAYTGAVEMVVSKGVGLQIYMPANSMAIYLAASSTNTTTYFINATFGTLSQNGWNHVAVVFTGTAYVGHLNGVATSLGAVSTAISTGTDIFYIGRYSSPAYYTRGYILNFRFVNGAAAYTGTFPAPTNLLTTSGSTSAALYSSTVNVNTTFAASNTSLLLNFVSTNTITSANAVNNFFLDSSSNNLDITAVGAVTQGTFSPYYPSGYWSTYFNGTTDWIQTTNTSTFDLSSSSVNFTIEAWVYNTKFGSSVGIIGARANASTTGWGLSSDASGILYLNGVVVGNAYANRQLNTNAILGDTWTHVALVKDATGYTCYINGIGGTKIALTGGLDYQSAQPITIGAVGSTGEFPFGGYISNFRIVKGTAVYTGNFVVPGIPLTQGQRALTNISALSNTDTALLTLQDNRSIDRSANNFSITRLGSPQIAQWSPFAIPTTVVTNYYSALFSSATSDTLTVAHNSMLVMDSNDFSIEFWIFPSSAPTSSNTIFSKSGSASGSVANWRLDYNSSFQLVLYVGRSSDVGSGSVSATLGTTATVTRARWSHVAVVKTGSVYSIYINGARAGAASFPLAAPSDAAAGALTIGNEIGRSNYVNGYLFNVRICKYVIPYVATATTITVPTSVLTATAGTVFLSLQDRGFWDSSVNNFAITKSTSIQPAAFNPFAAEPALYNTATYGGSGYFNGSTDYLTTPSNAAFAFGTGDFTLECWIYTIAASDRGIYEGRASGSGTTGFTLTAFTSSVIRVYTGSSALISSSGTTYLNTWTHVAVVRSSSITTLYINGTSVGTSASMGNLTDTTPVIGGGRYTGTTTVTSFFNGYISNFRMVKGTAVYTANFTLPTIPVTNITNTSLLLDFANAGVYDATGRNAVSLVGDARGSATVSIWNSAATVFDGTGDAVALPNSVNFGFGSGNFTVEFWMYPTSVASGYLFDSRTSVALQSVYCWFSASGSLQYAGGIITGGVTLTGVTANSWYYVVCTRNGSTAQMFVNGVSAGTAAISGSANNTNPMNIGYRYDATVGYTGYIQDFRVTPGVVRDGTVVPKKEFAMA